MYACMPLISLFIETLRHLSASLKCLKWMYIIFTEFTEFIEYKNCMWPLGKGLIKGGKNGKLRYITGCGNSMAKIVKFSKFKIQFFDTVLYWN